MAEILAYFPFNAVLMLALREWYASNGYQFPSASDCRVKGTSVLVPMTESRFDAFTAYQNRNKRSNGKVTTTNPSAESLSREAKERATVSAERSEALAYWRSEDSRVASAMARFGYACDDYTAVKNGAKVGPNGGVGFGGKDWTAVNNWRSACIAVASGKSNPQGYGIREASGEWRLVDGAFKRFAARYALAESLGYVESVLTRYGYGNGAKAPAPQPNPNPQTVSANPSAATQPNPVDTLIRLGVKPAKAVKLAEALALASDAESLTKAIDAINRATNKAARKRAEAEAEAKAAEAEALARLGVHNPVKRASEPQNPVTTAEARKRAEALGLALAR